MPAKVDLTGKVFGAIRVLSQSDHEAGKIRYLCECVCGKQFTAYANNLVRNKYKSCGCMKASLIGQAQREFGPHRESIRGIHKNMMDRCYNHENKRFDNYGGRGIKVCPKWHLFDNFYNDMETTYEKGLTIERKQVDGDYELTNCKWATRLEQNRNQRRTIYLNFRGETIGLRYLAEKFEIDPKLLDRRIRSGWDIERAILPARPIKKNTSTKNKE